MHDRLFADQKRLGIADLKRRAGEIGLDAARFAHCLDSGEYTDEVQRDLAQGAAYGVTGTPTFFVNGRVLGGAQPYEAFAEVVQEELARAGRRAGEPGTPADGGGR